MKNSHHQETFNPNEYNDWFAKYPWFERLMHNGKIIAIALLSVVVLFTLYFQLVGTSASEDVYYKAESDFMGLNQSIEMPDTIKNQQADLKNLEAILAKHPDLQAKYDGFIGQMLLN